MTEHVEEKGVPPSRSTFNLLAHMLILLILIVPNYLTGRGFNSFKNTYGAVPSNVSIIHPHNVGSTAVIEDNDAAQQKHWPRNFSNAYNLSNNLMRGNLYTTLGGCKFSRWVYNHPIGDSNMNLVYEIHNSSHAVRATSQLRKAARSMDCIYQPLQKWLNNASQLNPYDTVYVALNKVEHFVRVTLPEVKVPIVVISSLYATEINLDPFADQLLSNEHVLRWFLSNLGLTVPNHTHHAKVSPWPFGLAENSVRPRKALGVLQIYSKHVQHAPRPPEEKDVSLFLSYLSPSNERRQAIPAGEKQDASGYYGGLRSARFVFSPDGDRPDCYRHYEALGLGAVPITQLDPWTYRHLADGPAIFQNSNWDVSFWNTTLAEHNISVVNRNLVFEEYWMEYAEREVGLPLVWWDHQHKAQTTLEEIVLSLHA